jgi:hypothetical protein
MRILACMAAKPDQNIREFEIMNWMPAYGKAL